MLPPDEEKSSNITRTSAKTPKHIENKLKFMKLLLKIKVFLSLATLAVGPICL